MYSCIQLVVAPGNVFTITFSFLFILSLNIKPFTCFIILTPRIYVPGMLDVLLVVLMFKSEPEADLEGRRTSEM